MKKEAFFELYKAILNGLCSDYAHIGASLKKEEKQKELVNLAMEVSIKAAKTYARRSKEGISGKV